MDPAGGSGTYEGVNEEKETAWKGEATASDDGITATMQVKRGQNELLQGVGHCCSSSGHCFPSSFFPSESQEHC